MALQIALCDLVSCTWQTGFVLQCLFLYMGIKYCTIKKQRVALTVRAIIVKRASIILHFS